VNIDKLLATDEHFLLGVWLENAKNMSTDDQERRLYEYNARNQITLWGPDGNVCHCYHVFYCCSVLFLAVLDPRVDHTMDVFSLFISVLCHSD